MLDSIRDFITRRINPAASPRHQPGDGGAPRRVEVAACALLLELAHADGEFSDVERRHIEEVVRRHFGRDDAAVGELIELADQERRRSVDQFQFTRLITSEYNLGQRMVLAEAMWGVILADGEIAKHETYLVRRLANLLDLEPAYLAQARRTAEGKD